MSDKQQFDLLIIGSGEAGKNLAWAMAKVGRRTAVVEQAGANDAMLTEAEIVAAAMRAGGSITHTTHLFRE
jgi:pyruvate/2-oxoglutarate dehydrogenase complex dihydrolipoamide dehydrogenase (E3) component